MKKLVKHFDKKVSMIVPVYNVELYLRGCLDSLVGQTINPDEMEILLINDGSTDNSLEICREYEERYSNIKIYSKDNEGLSATRNYGINKACGKYLMYIDSDDMLANETVKEVTDFFDTVYDKVDLVTYLDQPYCRNQKLPLHFRYKYLTKTGVYTLDEYPFITQTRINMCTKNLYDDNVLFDTTPKFRHEDQKYCSDILVEKMKIGFCSKGEYQYNKSNESSIMATSFNPIELFETTTTYFENIFSMYTTVPKYMQAMFFNDISWKLKSDILFPYHYASADFSNAISRLKKLLSHVDNEIICEYPQIDNFHKAYWLTFKENSNVTVIDHSLISNNRVIYNREKVELIFYKLRISNGRLLMLLSAKSPVFNFTQSVNVYVII